MICVLAWGCLPPPRVLGVLAEGGRPSHHGSPGVLLPGNFRYFPMHFRAYAQKHETFRQNIGGWGGGIRCVVLPTKLFWEHAPIPPVSAPMVVANFICYRCRLHEALWSEDSVVHGHAQRNQGNYRRHVL